MSSLRDIIKDIQRATGSEVDGVFGPQTARRVLNALQGAVGMPVTKPADDQVIPAGYVEGELNARTLENIATLDVKARGRFIQFMLLANATAATFGCQYIMISGYRTWDEQAELKRKSDSGGPHAAAPGYSWHNFATAGDCGVFSGKAYLDDGSPSQQALAEKIHYAVAVHARSCGLEHGGTWKGKSCDPPHWQIDMGHSSPTAADRAKFKEKGTVL